MALLGAASALASHASKRDRARERAGVPFSARALASASACGDAPCGLGRNRKGRGGRAHAAHRLAVLPNGGGGERDQRRGACPMGSPGDPWHCGRAALLAAVALAERLARAHFVCARVFERSTPALSRACVACMVASSAPCTLAPARIACRGGAHRSHPPRAVTLPACSSSTTAAAWPREHGRGAGRGGGGGGNGGRGGLGGGSRRRSRIAGRA